MKTLLTTLNAKYIHTNLAIRLLYELNESNPDLSWREFTINEEPSKVADYCADFEVVAFSCYIWNITQTLSLATQIKARNPKVKILLGGPEVSYDWQDVILLEAVDYIITGEGETPFSRFMEAYPHTILIPNIVQKVDGKVEYMKDDTIFDLKNYAYSMPYRFDAPAALANKVLYLETSRGCPYKCEFCLASLDNKVRYLPTHSIKTTLLYMMQHGKVIKFLDRTFNMKRDFSLDIFQFIMANYRTGNVFQFEITADILHPDLMVYIEEHVPAGLFRFEIGIQTVNQKANLEVSRKQNFDKTKGIVQRLRHKVEMHLDLIVGLPHDYFEDIKFSIEEVFKLYPPELQLGFLKFLKGTPMLYKHAQHGYTFDPNPPYQIIQSNYLSVAELHLLELVENALEIYWNKPRACHTLRYVTEKYSIFDFFLGLGTYFSTQNEFHKHTLNDIYDNIFAFAKQAYPEDTVLHELIAIDYYLYYKIKPQINYLEELPQAYKTTFLRSNQLTSRAFRYVVLPISFDFGLFATQSKVLIADNHSIVVRYNGVSKPDYVAVQPLISAVL